MWQILLSSWCVCGGGQLLIVLVWLLSSCGVQSPQVVLGISSLFMVFWRHL